ncbi:hypothetical protein WHR41_02949 [Cladosporium halotolerans]|uniref:3'-5' exonuclease domain-containing protein n=1 Tax=Cladosporium halotolerans TaxID=1052096 RepID=A0AB34KYP3_9PEZI
MRPTRSPIPPRSQEHKDTQHPASTPSPTFGAGLPSLERPMAPSPAALARGTKQEQMEKELSSRKSRIDQLEGEIKYLEDGYRELEKRLEGDKTTLRAEMQQANAEYEAQLKQIRSEVEAQMKEAQQFLEASKTWAFKEGRQAGEEETQRTLQARMRDLEAQHMEMSSAVEKAIQERPNMRKELEQEVLERENKLDNRLASIRSLIQALKREALAEVERARKDFDADAESRYRDLNSVSVEVRRQESDAQRRINERMKELELLGERKVHRSDYVAYRNLFSHVHDEGFAFDKELREVQILLEQKSFAEEKTDQVSEPASGDKGLLDSSKTRALGLKRLASQVKEFRKHLSATDSRLKNEAHMSRLQTYQTRYTDIQSAGVVLGAALFPASINALKSVKDRTLAQYSEISRQMEVASNNTLREELAKQRTALSAEYGAIRSSMNLAYLDRKIQIYETLKLEDFAHKAVFMGTIDLREEFENLLNERDEGTSSKSSKPPGFRLANRFNREMVRGFRVGLEKLEADIRKRAFIQQLLNQHGAEEEKLDKVIDERKEDALEELDSERTKLLGLQKSVRSAAKTMKSRRLPSAPDPRPKENRMKPLPAQNETLTPLEEKRLEGIRERSAQLDSMLSDKNKLDDDTRARYKRERAMLSLDWQELNIRRAASKLRACRGAKQRARYQGQIRRSTAIRREIQQRLGNLSRHTSTSKPSAGARQTLDRTNRDDSMESSPNAPSEEIRAGSTQKEEKTRDAFGSVSAQDGRMSPPKEATDTETQPGGAARILVDMVSPSEASESAKQPQSTVDTQSSSRSETRNPGFRRLNFTSTAPKHAPQDFYARWNTQEGRSWGSPSFREGEAPTDPADVWSSFSSSAEHDILSKQESAPGSGEQGDGLTGATDPNGVNPQLSSDRTVNDGACDASTDAMSGTFTDDNAKNSMQAPASSISPGTTNVSTSSNNVVADMVPEPDEEIALLYDMPASVKRAAFMASRNSTSQFWKYNMYRNAAGEAPTRHYCTTYEQTEAQIAKFLDEKVVGFDLEWEKSSRPGVDSPKRCVSLMQIAAEGKVALFHLAVFRGGDSAEDLLPPALRAFLEDPSILKVGVNIGGDATRMKNCFGVEMRGNIELSHLFRLVKYGEKSPGKVNRTLVALAEQVKEVLHLPLSKGSVRTSSWSKRLDNEQIDYAVSDAYAGLRLFHELEKSRRAMPSKPPRPAFQELRLPITLGAGIVVPPKAKKTKVVPEPEEDPAEEPEPTAALEEEPDSEEDYYDAPEDPSLDSQSAAAGDPLPEITYPTLPTLASSDSSDLDSDYSLPSDPLEPPPSHPRTTPALPTPEALAAQTWATTWQAQLPAAYNLQVSQPHLRAYHVWHHQGFALQETAALLRREPPLALSTVVSYIAEVLQKEDLEFEPARAREVLGRLPVSVRGRYARLYAKVQRAT